AGDTVLIHGGSGGVGSAAIQIAKALGARVITTAGSPERCDACAELGADVTIDYHDDVPAAVAEATEGRGVDVILDILGAGGLTDNLSMLATDGRLVIIGLQRGRKAEINLQALMAKRLTVTGTLLRSRPRPEKAAIVADVAKHVWPMVADGRIKPVVHDRLPLAEAMRGQELLESGTVFGKVLLVP
ncbi:MAG TPA: zinc-binding dehydrogenase, partial [Actinomycetaceae bacterium]|nr:zinc-binding dehydrogenase [Actinomycetaceae bacterium]